MQSYTEKPQLQKFLPNKNLPHNIISSFFFRCLFWHFGKTIFFCYARYTSSVTMELTWRDVKYWKGKFSLSGSLLSCGGLKPERAFPQLPAVLFVWTATGHKSGRHCPPFRRPNTDRGSGFRWNAFEGGKKHHFRLKANVKTKTGKSRSRSARRNSIQISSLYPVLLFLRVMLESGWSLVLIFGAEYFLSVLQ